MIRVYRNNNYRDDKDDYRRARYREEKALPPDPWHGGRDDRIRADGAGP
jgi:hypothetical protein